MKDALTNLFKTPGPTTTLATVVKPLSTTRYEVVDAAGKTSFASSSDFYPVGAGVIIQDGIIIGAGIRAGSIKTYEV